jgi:1,2-dihydroxy-3-keto-5-methylthiopentene dioxygenase
MAILRIEGGQTYTNIKEIQQQLNCLNVQIQQVPLEKYLVNPEMSKLLKNVFSQEILNLSQKQEILQALTPKCATGQHIDNCTWCELMAVNPSSPNLYQLLAQGSRPQWYAADEVIYLLTGECILGFSHPNGCLLELMLQPQDYLKIPARLRHWFSLSALLQLKAVRYFTTAKTNLSCLVN